MNQPDDAPFTTGEFSINSYNDLYCKGRVVAYFPQGIISAHPDALIGLAAFNAATSLHLAGYDAQKVFEALPEIIDRCKEVNALYPYSHAERPLITSLRRKPKL